MPRLSVIVPVYNVEGFLRECLRSILDQSYRDFELIAVEDRSTDGSDEVLSDIASSDHRVRVIHSEKNAGLGAARNTGLAAAVGDWVLFVDSDDVLRDGAFEAMMNRAEATASDLVIFDYERTYWWGKAQRNVVGYLLSQAPTGTFSVHDYPEVFELLNVAWNKLYSRKFLIRLDLPFPDGFYEDIPWTYPALMEAECIAVVDEVLYQYRQRRTGNILRTKSSRHFDVFMQYDRLFDWLGRHPEHAGFHGYFFEKMVRHTLGMWAGGKRLPAGERREFFSEISVRCIKHRPPEHEWPPGLEGLRHNLAAHDRYLTYRVLKAVNGILRRVKKLGRTLIRRVRRTMRRTRSLLKQTAYRAFLFLPVDPNLAVFTAYWDTKVAGNPKAIYQETRANRPEIRGVWLLKELRSSHSIPNRDIAIKDSLKYLWVLARARVFVNNVNFPNFFVKRPDSVFLQTQHGTPLKSMGLDLRNFASTQRSMNFKKLLARVDNWDYNLCSNPYSSEIWKSAFPSDFQNVNFGYPRNDCLVRGDDSAVTRIRRDLAIPEGHQVALYAPTFRDYRSSFRLDLDPDIVLDALGVGWVLVVRSHYFDQVASDFDGLVIDGGGVPDVQELLLATDFLITDYSSVMFDFAVLNRPIAIFAPDWERYKTERGVYFDLLGSPPGPVAQDHDDLARLISSREFLNAESDSLLQQFRKRFCEWDDGNAASRVVELLWPSSD